MNNTNPDTCPHTSVIVSFDPDAAKHLSVEEIRKRRPRFHGTCPDCGCTLIKYASLEHYIYGDW